MASARLSTMAADVTKLFLSVEAALRDASSQAFAELTNDPSIKPVAYPSRSPRANSLTRLPSLRPETLGITNFMTLPRS